MPQKTLSGHVLTAHAVRRITERDVRPADLEIALVIGSIVCAGGDKLICCRRRDLARRTWIDQRTARRLGRLVIIATHSNPPRIKTVVCPPDPWAYVKKQIKSGRNHAWRQ